MKTTWTTPQLVKLARGAPDEAVLRFCRTSATGTAPNATAEGCQSPTPIGADCVSAGKLTGSINVAAVCSQCSDLALS